MNQARLARCRATSRREFAFWNLVLQIPARERTRAQRRHAQSRQKRNRLLALEVLVWYAANRQLRKTQDVPLSEESRAALERGLDDARNGRFAPDLVVMPAEELTERTT